MIRRHRLLFALSSLSLFALGCTPQMPPTVAFMSDFGVTDDSVAVCKGEMIKVSPGVRVVDITHQVTPYDVNEASRLLAGSMGNFPPGVVFVCVVDPGVGSMRRPVAVRTKSGHFYVGPDNGLVSLVDDIAEAREITNTAWMAGGKRSSTFHGRDIFSPVASHLAKGDSYSDVGPAFSPEQLVRLEVSKAVILDGKLTGDVIGLDGPYGNLVTNIAADLFAELGYRIGDEIKVRLGTREMTLPLVHTFSDVPEGKPLLYIDSRGRLSAAINMGDFAKVHGVTPPVRMTIGRRN